MSRIGRKPLEIPKGVQVSITKDQVTAKGPKGTLTVKRHQDIEISEDQGSLVFARNQQIGRVRAAHGLMRALCANMFTGVTKGFERHLEINGVGYTHPVEFKLPEGISAKVEKNVLILSGIDRQALGAAAAKVRSFRPPEPYKGKGIKYSTETIIRKAGKTAGK